MDSPLSLRFALRIGVTGHIFLQYEPAVAEAVRRVIDRIGSVLAPGAAVVAWTVVSPLARGADQIVSDAVLARPARW